MWIVLSTVGKKSLHWPEIMLRQESQHDDYWDYRRHVVRNRFNDRVETRMGPASRQSVQPSSSTSTQTALSRRVWRRIATGSFERNLPRASRPYVDNATMDNAPQFASKNPLECNTPVQCPAFAQLAHPPIPLPWALFEIADAATQLGNRRNKAHLFKQRGSVPGRGNM